MNFGLQGKTALVTGASQGIGREIARALHAEGVALVVVSQSNQRLQQAVREIVGQEKGGAAIFPIVADLSIQAEVAHVAQESLARLGHLDILVNNAARTRYGRFFEMSDAELQEPWQVKGLGYVRLVHALAPHMIQRRSGNIVNIIGNAARTPDADFIVGSMVNAALVNFTRGIARELGRHNVRVNAISPGWTKTAGVRRGFEMKAAAQNVPVEEIERREARGAPMNRLADVSEVVALTLLLVSDLCPSLTGEDIVLDGGATPSI